MKKNIWRACLIFSPVAVLALLCMLAIFALPAQKVGIPTTTMFKGKLLRNKFLNV